MTPAQKQQLEKAIQGISSAQVFPQGQAETWSLGEQVRATGLIYVSVDHVTGIATGFSSDGAEALEALVDSLRDRSVALKRGTLAPALIELLAEHIKAKWRALSASMV